MSRQFGTPLVDTVPRAGGHRQRQPEHAPADAGPLPTMRSWALSCFGGGPLDLGICGFLLRSRSPAVGWIFVTVGAGADAGCDCVCCRCCCSARSASLSAVLSLVLLPQAASPRAATASTAGSILLARIMPLHHSGKIVSWRR